MNVGNVGMATAAVRSARGVAWLLGAVLMGASAKNIGVCAVAEEPSAEPAELRTLRMEYQQRLLKARAPADEWYRMQLRGHLPRYQKAGNLDVATLLQAEISDPDPDRVMRSETAFPPDLVGIRSAYAMQAQRLTAPVREWYRQQLQGLERGFTQQGDFASAKAVRAALEGLAPVASRSSTASTPTGVEGGWRNLLGGSVKGDEKGVTLKGPGHGHGALELAMAFLRTELSRDFTVSGRFKVSGNAGGFALGRDEEECVTVYWSRGTSWAVQHVGTERRVLDRPSLAWKPDTWQEFELRRQGSDLTVRIDDSAAVIRLPRGIGRWQFGVMTAYQPSAMEVRNLNIGGTPEVNR